MTNLCWATNLLGDVWRHVTTVAKFLDLNNFSWRRRPFALLNDGRKVWVTVLFLSAIMHRKVIHVSFFFFFFLLYLQDYGLLRTRNFLPWQRDVTTTLHPLRIHSSGSSVFLCLRKQRAQLIEELFGNQDRYNLLTCNDTNHSGSQKKSISVISSQG